MYIFCICCIFFSYIIYLSVYDAFIFERNLLNISEVLISPDPFAKTRYQGLQGFPRNIMATVHLGMQRSESLKSISSKPLMKNTSRSGPGVFFLFNFFGWNVNHFIPQTVLHHINLRTSDVFDANRPVDIFPNKSRKTHGNHPLPSPFACFKL